MVAAIQNTTRDQRFNAIGTILRMQLDQSTYFNVVEPSQVSAVFEQMLVRNAQSATAEQHREGAWRLNAATLVFGTVAYVGTLPALTVQVEWRGSSPQNPSNQLTKSFPAHSSSDLSTSVRDAANWIRESAGDSSQREAQYDRLPEDVTTPSWEALAYYAKAEQFAAVQSRDEALFQLDSALRLDPSFTLAAQQAARRHLKQRGKGDRSDHRFWQQGFCNPSGGARSPGRGKNSAPLGCQLSTVVTMPRRTSDSPNGPPNTPRTPTDTSIGRYLF